MTRARMASTAALGAALGLLACSDAPIAGPDDGALFWSNDSSAEILHRFIEELILSQTCDLWVDDRGFPDLALYVNALTGGPTFENELHDCQRLEMPGGEYGPMIGVFPIDQGATKPPYPSLPQNEWVAVASVFNWGDGTNRLPQPYEPLGIVGTDPWSCIWVKLSAAGDSARIQSVRSNRTECHKEPSAGTDLAIKALPPSGGVTQTARIRWNPDAYEGEGGHFLGFRCGNRWCHVAGSMEVLTDSADGPHGFVGTMDEQKLAVGERHNLRPGPLARIIPAPGLADRDEVADWNGFIRAAEIQVDTDEADPNDLARYVRKFHLVTTDPETYRQDVWINMADGTASYGHPDADGSVQVSMRILDEAPHGAPGSVRWRWREDDEEIWISCLQGCCYVEGGAN